MFRQVFIPTYCTDIYEYIVSANTRYYVSQKSILQESSFSMWVGQWTGRQTKLVVPFTNRLMNVLYLPNTIYPQKVTLCTCYTAGHVNITLVFKNASNLNIKHAKL